MLRQKLSGHEVDFHETKSAGDAARISSDILQGDSIRYIMVAGGDGTLNEAIQPLIGSSVVVVPIPAGTGSDFCKTLGIDSVESAVNAVNSGKVIAADTVMCKWDEIQRYFVNILEIGFGASVMSRVNASERKGQGVFRRSVMRQLISLKNYPVTVEIDGRRFEMVSPEIIIANGKYFGGGMLASPESSISDGLADVHIIGKLGRYSLLRRFSRLIDGTYVSDHDVSNFSSRKIVVRGGAPVEMDGETVGALPMSMDVIPGSVIFGLPDSSDVVTK